jgi:hypothetical protein
VSRRTLWVVIADVLLLTGLYYVVLDLQWRSAYASSIHYACEGPCSYTASFSRSILTQFFTMTGNNASLTSPPTLDWVQLLVLALVLINVWYGYSFIFERRKEGSNAAAGAEAPPGA